MLFKRFVTILIIGVLLISGCSETEKQAQTKPQIKQETVTQKKAQVKTQKPKRNLQREKELKTYLDENFFMTSWYDKNVKFRAEGDTIDIMVKDGTTKEKCEGLGKAVFGFINQNGSQYQGKYNYRCLDPNGKELYSKRNPLK